MQGVDLFSGAGGMSLGAMAAGVKILQAVEMDKCAADTYVRNHPKDCQVFAGDIRDFTPSDIDYKLPKVVFGGPPCQGFSTSNQKTRNSDNPNNWLFQEFVRVVSEVMPDWFVFENVRGILETEGGLFVEKAKNAFENLGYSVNFDVLNAADYGVPQKRARFFMVGSLHGVNFEFPEPTVKNHITVKDALHDLPDLLNGANFEDLPYKCPANSNYAISMRNESMRSFNHFVTRNAPLIIERYKHVPQGGNWQNIPARLMKNYTDRNRCHTRIYHRLDENNPSSVIGNYRKNMLIHPQEHRGLSVREAARLQSFPDWFKFSGSIGFQQQQVGNAVPPLLAEAVFKKIMSY